MGFIELSWESKEVAIFGRKVLKGEDFCPGANIVGNALTGVS
jgi:hypothetical protein